jgi:transaldolase
VTQLNPLAALSAAGVSIWLDDISRQRLNSGNLAGLVRDKYVVGVTSNPTIFAAALTHGEFYTDQMRELATRGASVDATVREVTTTDIRNGCDLFRDVYERSNHVDGRVSIEVDPRLAKETDRTVAEAVDLWKTVDRPNLLIKIPATVEGLPAVTRTLAEGVSVNVTLIFSVERYREVMDAYLAGLERARENGHNLAEIHSVASFFVSRVDTEVDKRLEAIGTDEARELLGQAAIANTRLAYAAYQEVFGSERWRKLAEAGANPQRPLWASTGVKNPEYSDTRYVDQLVAPGVVNTMPEKTVLAVEDHGRIEPDTVSGRAEEAQRVFDALTRVGVNVPDVFHVLETEGVDKFVKSWEELLDTVRAALDQAKG